MALEHDSAEQDTMIGAALEKYEILQKIGEGSIGTIYKGRDLQSGEDVAIKFLTREITHKPQILARFKREIQTAVKMRHPNIVRGFTAGVWEGCIYYYVMEFVDGPTLHEIIVRERMPEARVLRVAFEISSALQYVHEFGMVHRDIKPENIMINSKGEAKLADLGLAKEINDISGLTMVGTIIGTPLYMSPEQAKGAAVIDIRADIYSLGASLYHAATGEPPFKGRTAPEVIAKQIEAKPTPPRDLNPSLTAGMEYVIRRMMEKDPAARYQSPTDLIADLNLLIQGKGDDASPELPWAKSAVREGKKFRFAFSPGEDDFEYGLTAVANTIIDKASMAKMLDFQEVMAGEGVPLRLSHVAVERGYIKPDFNRKILDAQARQREMEQGTGIGKLAVKKNLATDEQIQAALSKQKALREEGRFRLLGEILTENGVIGEEGIRRLLATQKQLKFAKEDRDFLDIAVRFDLIPKRVSEKVALIQKNEIAMNRYRRIGEILADRRFLPSEACDVILRALRRSQLTAEKVDDLIREKIVTSEAATLEVRRDEAMLEKYRAFIAKQIKLGKSLMARKRYSEAIDAFRAVLETVASNTEAEKQISDAENVIQNMKSHEEQARQHFKAAIGEWEGILKIDPSYPAAVEAVREASAKIAALLGPGQAPQQAAPFSGAAAEQQAEKPKSSRVKTSSGRLVPAEPQQKPAPDAPSPQDTLPDQPAQTDPESGEDGAGDEKVVKLLKQARRLEKLGKRSDAEKKYAEILEADPGHADARAFLDKAYRGRRNALMLGCLSLLILVAAGLAVAWFAVPENFRLSLALKVLPALRSALAAR